MYLRATRHVHTHSLFVNPHTLVAYTKARTSQLIRRIVKWSQPGVYARAHDLSKLLLCKSFIILCPCTRSRYWVFGTQTIPLRPVISLLLSDPLSHAWLWAQCRVDCGTGGTILTITSSQAYDD